MPQAPKIFGRQLMLGEKLPTLTCRDARGKPFSLHSLIGHPVVIFYFLNFGRPQCDAELQAFQSKVAEFREAGVSIIGMSQDTPEKLAECVKKYSILFPLLSDPDLIVAKELGVGQWVEVGPKEAIKVVRTTFILDARLRLRMTYQPHDMSAHAPQILAELPLVLPENDKKEVVAHGPILIIPSLFEPQLCRELIKQEQISSRLLSVIDKHLYDRVVPELANAFQYQPSRRENPTLVIQTTGHTAFNRIRLDVTPQTMHRQFTIQVFLNEGYTGGGICFPEYGRAVYRLSLGDGIVHSSALLQEILPIEAGSAIRLQCHFYSEEQAKLREAMSKKTKGTYRMAEGELEDPRFE